MNVILMKHSKIYVHNPKVKFYVSQQETIYNTLSNFTLKLWIWVLFLTTVCEIKSLCNASCCSNNDKNVVFSHLYVSRKLSLKAANIFCKYNFLKDRTNSKLVSHNLELGYSFRNFHNSQQQ